MASNPKTLHFLLPAFLGVRRVQSRVVFVLTFCDVRQVTPCSPWLGEAQAGW